MRLTLGFSPCPNDTFIFDALVNQKIDTGDLEFDVLLEDVETLNQWALEGRLDITKLSFPAFFQSLEHYVLLHAGSALGMGVGPLLVSNTAAGIATGTVKDHLVALPGQHTTANLLFSFAFPDATQKTYMRFDQIEDYVLANRENNVAGVIIHENRFTYRDKGLEKIADLGSIWEEQMKIPVPLGGIAIRQSIKRTVALKAEGLIRQSLEYAFSHYPEIPPYVKEHSQTMSEEVMRQHIELYVNNFSLGLGTEGKEAVAVLYDVFMGSRVSGKPDFLQSEKLFL